VVWLDLQCSEPQEVEDWFNKLGITGLARRLCLDARDSAGFYPLKNELVLIIPVFQSADDPDSSTALDYVAFYCTGNLVFSIHQKPLLNEQRLAELQEEQDWLPEPSIPGLVSTVMMKLSLDSLRCSATLRDAVLELEERMERDPDSVEVEEFVDIRNDLFPLGVAVADQLPLIEELSTTTRPFLEFKEARDYMNCALVNIKAAELSIDWLDRRIAALRNDLQMRAQEKTNRRLGMLTILSAIFMPLTLMAGIWGMNFEHMPELAYWFMYPVALGSMAVVGVGMFLFFRRSGWFD
jgi:magnesium transporter